MSRSFITMHLRVVRCDLAFETLERRQVMSISVVTPTAPSQSGNTAAETSTVSSTAAEIQPLDKISVSPSDGQAFSVSSAPQTIIVEMKDARLSTLSVDTWWRDGSVFLVGVGSNGETFPIQNSSNPSVVIQDSTAHTATISFASPLAPGRYRIVLAGGDRSLSRLLDDGSWNYMEDQTLSEFQVMGKAPTLDDAVDLGAIGSNIQTIPGYLDIRGGTGVTLYKITLGTNQPLWRLGLQLDAQRIGSTLQAAITLFDQQGRALKASDSGTGLGTLVGDPYMFSALKPGVYYVGISGVGNLGGQPGGYDPRTGEPGISSRSQTGGPFHLEVVADPLTSSTEVTGFELQRDDSTSASPTGFTISFSDAIDPNSLQGDSLYVRDQQGQLFPVFLGPVADARFGKLTFYFSQPLTPGEYSLVVPREGGLTNLIGLTPVAADLPADVLATWTIQAPPAGTSGDGGGIPLGLTRLHDNVVGAVGTAVLASGGDITYRFIVPLGGTASLTTDVSIGTLRAQLVKDDGTVVIESDPDGRFNTPLAPGVYVLRLSAVGPESVAFGWQLQVDLNEAFQIGNAVGSAGALSLRMGGAVTPDAYGSPMGSGGPAPFSTVAGPVSISTLPSSFTVTVGAALVGRPSARNDAFSVVGPTVSGGLLALADSSRGLIAGILPAAAYGDDGQIRSPDGLLVKKDTSEKQSNLTEPGTLDDELRRTDGEEQGVQADALALLEADRLAEAARSVSPWLFRGVEDGLEALANGSWLDSMVLARTGGGDGVPDEAARGDDEHSGQVERATLGVPISLVVAAAAAFRFRQLSRKWWCQSPSKAKPTKSPQPSLWRGPRFMVPPHSRTSRSRTSHHV